MKKLFVLSCAAFALASCTSEDETPLGGDSQKQSSNLVKVDAITRAYIGDASMSVAPVRNDKDFSVAYVKNQKGEIVEIDKNISMEYVNVICNEGYGFFHGENGWACKNVATGTLDNNRMTYSWFINDKGERQSLEPEQNDQGLLLTGSNCDVTKMVIGKKRVAVKVGDEWFDDKFAMAQQFIDEALKTPASFENYKDQNGVVSNYTYEVHEYAGYKVIVLDGEALSWNSNGSMTGSNYGVMGPWFEKGTTNYTFETDHSQETMDHNVVLVPMGDIEFNGTNMNCHIFAPEHKVTLRGGGCPSGLVICDVLDTETEIHGNWTPKFPEYNPGKEQETVPDLPDGCETNILIDLDIKSEYIVIADDFAIQNGDKLYMNAAIEGEEHVGVKDGNGEGAYVFVKKGENVHINVDNICDLYPSYVGKTDKDGVPYINEVGELTLVVYLWPGQIDNETGAFSSINVGEGYLIGEKNVPVQHAVNSKDYNIMVSAYKGLQGVGAKEDGTFDEKGWSYVKVSIHIAPKSKVEAPSAE